MSVLVGHFGPNFEDTDIIDSEGIVELFGELGIHVPDEHLRLSGVPCDDGGHVLALLGDPCLRGIRGDAGKVNAAGADMDEEEQKEVGESGNKRGQRELSLGICELVGQWELTGCILDYGVG